MEPSKNDSLFEFWKTYVAPKWLQFWGLFFTEIILLSLYFLFIKQTFWWLVAILILIFFIWLYQRKLPKFSEDEIGILFAFPLESEFTKQQMKKLYRTINFHVNQKNLNIKVRELPANHIPKNEEMAHKIRDSANAQLIVWGNIEEGYHRDEKKIFIIPILFSYRINLVGKPAEILRDNFCAVIREGKWNISEKESVKDRLFVSESVERVSLYIIGLVFYFAKNFPLSINILKELFDKYKEVNGLSKVEKDSFVILKIAILRSYNFKIKEEGFSPKDVNDKEKIKKGYQIIKEIREIEKDSPAAYSLEATLTFITTRDHAKAFELVIKQGKNLLYEDASFSYSKAFLCFYGNNLEHGWNHLREAVEEERRRDNPVDIVAFYEETLDREPDKKQLHFPLGFLYLKDLDDKRLAKEEFIKFIEAYKDKGEGEEIIKELLNVSRILLEECKKSQE